MTDDAGDDPAEDTGGGTGDRTDPTADGDGESDGQSDSDLSALRERVADLEKLREQMAESETLRERLDALDDEIGDVDEDHEAEIDELRDTLDEFREDIDERTLHRDEIERDLRRYVRRRVRRGHARGWGPYLVLLYGTAMTIGAFYFLSGGWAILAMLVIWLSTLGLYVLMLIVGFLLGLAGKPGRVADRVRDWRE
ncbi:MAG: hypothetical protein ABEH35_05175 [Haloarculaceae archaeon]